MERPVIYDIAHFIGAVLLVAGLAWLVFVLHDLELWSRK